MTNNTENTMTADEKKALDFVAEKELQRRGIGTAINLVKVVDELSNALAFGCCLEAFAARLLEDASMEDENFRLLELLSIDVSRLATEIGEIRDEVESVRAGKGGRYAA